MAGSKRMRGGRKMTTAKPAGVKANKNAQDAQLEIGMVQFKLRSLLRNASSRDDVIALALDAMEHADAAAASLRTVISVTGRGKSME